MRLPKRPKSIDDLQKQLSSGELRESRTIEFKREFPGNRVLAKQVAGLAVEGGVLVIGVDESVSGLKVRLIDCEGAREHVEQIARDIPEPPVQVESYILHSETPGQGVLWIEIHASPAMLHQVGGTYYERGDSQTRPMRDTVVADRMRLRERRDELIEDDLEVALNREEPGSTSWQGRTCIVARPIGASEDEFFRSTQRPDDWESFAYGLCQPSGMLPPTPDRYWGLLKSNLGANVENARISGQLFSFRDIEFHESGGFCHLSYCHDWLRDRKREVFPFSALRACMEVLKIVSEVQGCTAERRMWDFACLVSNVGGRTARTRVEDRYHPAIYMPTIPRNSYTASALGVSTQRLELDPRSVIAELLGRFIAECNLKFDAELPASMFSPS